MIFKIILSNGNHPIRVNSKEEVSKIFEQIFSNAKLIVTKEGVFNPSFLVEIVPDTETYHNEYCYLTRPEEIERKDQELKNKPSPFASILANKKEMFSNPKVRTEIQEQIAREERRLKAN
jgi:hypothetical protein